MASGSVGHAATIRDRSGSCVLFCATTAPDFAALALSGSCNSLCGNAVASIGSSPLLRTLCAGELEAPDATPETTGVFLALLDPLASRCKPKRRFAAPDSATLLRSGPQFRKPKAAAEFRRLLQSKSAFLRKIQRQSVTRCCPAERGRQHPKLPVSDEIFVPTRLPSEGSRKPLSHCNCNDCTCGKRTRGLQKACFPLFRMILSKIGYLRVVADGAMLRVGPIRKFLLF